MLPVLIASLFTLGSDYRASYQQYLLAKNQYQQYQTESTRLTAIDKVKRVLKSRNDWQLEYFKTLRQTLASDTSIANYPETTSYLTLEDEIIALEKFTSDFNSISSLSQAQDFSESWEDRYSRTQTLVGQTRNQIIKARLANFQNQLAPYIDASSPSSTLDLAIQKLKLVSSSEPGLAHQLLLDAAKLLAL